MTFFTSFGGVKPYIGILIGFLLLAGLASAQTTTNSSAPDPDRLPTQSSTSDTNASSTPSPIPAPATTENSSPVQPAPTIMTSPAPDAAMDRADFQAEFQFVPNFSLPALCALLTLASLGGFMLYQCGLTRAKNSGHTSALLLVGTLFALTAYWIGGFGAQAGGIGDAHAALTQSIPQAERGALDHELGFLAFGHHWGLMGNSGFFLATDRLTRNGVAELFLAQASLMAIAVAAAMGAALERGKVLAMAFCAYLFGLLIYPLLANWVWGGGWLAEMGREFSLGNGFVDLGGAAVVHESAGVLALVIAVILGPRHGRFGRNTSNAIPGHNVPFFVLGSLILLVAWMASNALVSDNLPVDPKESLSTSAAALAAVNTLLAAMGGTIVSFIQAAMRKRRPEPAWLCRGLLGGAVASSGCAGLIDPWAAFLIGIAAGWLVQQAVEFLERKRIDDPVGAAAVHGMGGVWGVIAVGLFADGADGGGVNGVDAPVRGLFYGGAWHQLAAQFIGATTTFAVICLLSYVSVTLIQKILGTRVTLAEETEGLDLSEVGALGYQGDVEPEE
jgi:ammonium transporter, Amt family